MNLEDIQPFVVARLQAAPSLAGVPILADDGTYPKTPQREQKLRDVGLVIIVWQIESDGLGSAANGFAEQDLYIPVLIEENPVICRAVGGLNIPAEKALRLVQSIVPGRPITHVRPGHSVEVHDPPFRNFGTIQGVRRIVANFVLRSSPIIPT